MFVSRKDAENRKDATVHYLASHILIVRVTRSDASC